MNKAEQLIACLEGEIAKRDARIVELEGCKAGLESDVVRLREKNATFSAAWDELSAIKAQEPVAWPEGGSDAVEGAALGAFDSLGQPEHDLESWCAGYAEAVYAHAAPVSEAKAQCVVMPDGWRIRECEDVDADLKGFIISSPLMDGERSSNSVWHTDADPAHKLLYEMLASLDEVARLNASPVQQVSVADGSTKMQWPEIVALVNEVLGCEAHKYPCERGSIGHEMTGINFNSLARIIDRVRYAAAPAAPAADAGLVEAACSDCNGSERQTLPDEEGVLRDVKCHCVALAAHRAQGVV